MYLKYLQRTLLLFTWLFFLQIQQLREEESSLRKENLRLMEEVLRLKHEARIQSPSASKYTPPVQVQNIPALYVGLGIVLALVGIVLGKFVL